MKNIVVRSFPDFDVYQRLYKAMVIVMKEVIPNLPKEEQYDLTDQMRRSCKAPLAIIAEGYAKKNYQKDWIKYINQAMGECNEMIVHLSCCRDLYATKINVSVINNLIDEYTISGKQLYRLGESWKK